MWHQIKSYFTFFIKSSNQHGIHSPFVYDLVTKCFYNKNYFQEYNTLKKYRNLLLKDSTCIEITDFGEGSRVFSSPIRKISDIAKNAGVPYKRQQLLFRLARYFECKKITELGTSLGLATISLALGKPSANITTIEGCKNTSEKAKTLFNKFQLKNIHVYNETFDDFFLKNTDTFHFMYIDGNHNKEQTLQYFKIILDKIENNTILIFDDIYWSKAMTEAWKKIYSHPKVTVSIDTFYWGLVFFRKEQKKQHFRIRL